MVDILIGFIILAIYFIACASLGVGCRKLFKIPDEIFRKILHFVLLTSLFVFVFAFKVWWHSVIVCLLIIIVAYPILHFFERFKSYSNLVTERKKGELKESLIIVFTMFMVVISICWGCFHDKILVLVVIYSWGYGDAFAALIGKKYGKHKIYKNKSIEGSLAMFITTVVVVFTILIIHNIIPWYATLIVSFASAITTTTVELYTPNGLDTATCPLASLAVMLPIIYLFGGLL